MIDDYGKSKYLIIVFNKMTQYDIIKVDKYSEFFNLRETMIN